MTPTTSPFLISKDKSRSAQKVSVAARFKGWRTRASIDSARVEGRLFSCAMVYALDTPRTAMATSDDIGEIPFHALERV